MPSPRRPTRSRTPSATTRTCPPKPAVPSAVPIEKRRGPSKPRLSFFARAFVLCPLSSSHFRLTCVGRLSSLLHGIPGCSMASNYLIDGYNLLYALGALEGRKQAQGMLERARLRLL